MFATLSQLYRNFSQLFTLRKASTARAGALLAARHCASAVLALRNNKSCEGVAKELRKRCGAAAKNVRANEYINPKISKLQHLQKLYNMNYKK